MVAGDCFIYIHTATLMKGSTINHVDSWSIMLNDISAISVLTVQTWSIIWMETGSSLHWWTADVSDWIVCLIWHLSYCVVTLVPSICHQCVIVLYFVNGLVLTWYFCIIFSNFKYILLEASLTHSHSILCTLILTCTHSHQGKIRVQYLAGGGDRIELLTL